MSEVQSLAVIVMAGMAGHTEVQPAEPVDRN